MSRRRYHHFGDDATVVVSPPLTPSKAAKTGPVTVTGHIANTLHLVARPVKWGVNTVGSVLQWAGGTLHSVSNKF